MGDDLYFENDMPDSPTESYRFDYSQALHNATSHARQRAGYEASLHTLLNDDGDFRGEVAELNSVVENNADEEYGNGSKKMNTWVIDIPTWRASTPYYSIDVPRYHTHAFRHLDIIDEGLDYVEVRAKSMDDLTEVTQRVVRKVVEYHLY